MNRKVGVLITGLFVAGAVALADDEKKVEKPKKAARPELEDGVKRAFKLVRSMDDYKLMRFHVCNSPDKNEGPGVLCFAELGTGDLALILAAKDPENDQFILIEKANMEQLEEAVHRCRIK